MLLAGQVAAEDWPHWRGLSRTAVVRERSGWQGRQWLSLDDVLWTSDVGQGASSPVVANRRVYTLGWVNDQDRVVCLDLDTGHEIWSASYPAPLHGRHATGDEGLHDGPTSTPALDVSDGRLYTLSVDGDLKSWDSTNGRLTWSLNLYEKYNVPQRPRIGRSGRRDYGYTFSPLVYQVSGHTSSSPMAG